jgi:BASS family bile acid:Na+ symporter
MFSGDAIIRLFPVWAAVAALLAYYFPDAFVAFTPAIVPLLGLVMFGMGITLTGRNFIAVARRPMAVALGVALQFLMMPFLGWLLAYGFGFTPGIAAGVILVGCCPGGTASNVICYLSGGDVALSITLTTASTLLAVIATPLLAGFYAGQFVPVPVGEMLLSIIKIVLVPVIAGVVINRYLVRNIQAVAPFFAFMSMLAIVIIIAIIVAANHDQIGHSGASVAAAVILHNCLGVAGGYWIARLLGREERECRTLAIEVGMQNSGLAVALAVKYFSAAAALPGALFSIWHNLSGSILASFWQRRSLRDA